MPASVTCEEVKDGHVYDVEEPAGRVAIQFLQAVAEERIHLPPTKTNTFKGCYPRTWNLTSVTEVGSHPLSRFTDHPRLTIFTSLPVVSFALI